MKTVISYVSRYEDYFRAIMEQQLRLSSEAAICGHKKRLAQAGKSIGKLDRLFIRIYENNVAGRLDDERFAMMNKNYIQEQKGLKSKVISLQQMIKEQERQTENLEQFIQRIKKQQLNGDDLLYPLRTCQGGSCRYT